MLSYQGMIISQLKPLPPFACASDSKLRLRCRNKISYFSTFLFIHLFVCQVLFRCDACVNHKQIQTYLNRPALLTIYPRYDRYMRHNLWTELLLRVSSFVEHGVIAGCGCMLDVCWMYGLYMVEVQTIHGGYTALNQRHSWGYVWWDVGHYVGQGNSRRLYL